MSLTNRKKPKSDLRNYYNLYLEAGLVIALVLLLVIFNVPFNPKNNENFSESKQETVKMKQVVQTHQHKTPPPPPTPQTPVAVPNDQVINDNPINMNAELDLNAPLKTPPPPPKKKKKKDNSNHVFVVVEHMPKLIGGLKALQQKIHYPELARKAGIEGRVYVQFVVDKHGNVQNAHVVRGIGGGCDKEALRVVKQAKFKPGMQRGRPVKVQYSLPIVFKLQD
ncbi:MAG TPA: energy transducer TonB [Balneolales bacterium]|nr:energy transducer TonB [Balneolales bacterium]